MARKTRICVHGLSDSVEITDRTIVEDFRHRTRSTIYGYFCQQHGMFGSHMVMETDVDFSRKPRESTPK